MNALQHSVGVSAARGNDDARIRELMCQVLGESQLISRRSFLSIAGTAASGLVLAFYMNDSVAADSSTSKQFAPNAYLNIATDGVITIYSVGPELGQGIKTAYALIVAEELDARWSDVHVEQAPIDESLYGWQGAGGSTSIPRNWTVLRQAGAVARSLLVSAAAKKWNTTADVCHAKESRVYCNDGRSIDFAALADDAALLPVPDAKAIKLKDRKDYTLFGKRYTGVDNLKVVTGQPLFGIDTVLPNMLHAVYQKCPAFGGTVKSANLDEIRNLPGVKDAFVIDGNGQATELLAGVAIVADSTWTAFKARQQLQVEWDETHASTDGWQHFVQQASDIARQPGKETTGNKGDVDAVFSRMASPQGRMVDAFYSYPFISHATLEPQNCTAWYHDGIMELWVPSQNATQAVKLVATLLDMPAANVRVHQTRVGGGFGRRLMNDYVCEAAMIARRVAAPVKLTWTREDDMTHDFYRVGGFHAFRGAVDDHGKLVAWQDHFITFTADGRKPVSGGDLSADEFPGPLLSNFRLAQTLIPSGTPCGPLRAPRSNAVAFVIQSFIHELAHAANRDHVEFLLEIMGEPRWLKPGNPYALNTGRAAGVIRLAAEKGEWGKSLPKGHGRGIAFHFSHQAHVAVVVELSVTASKQVKVHHVTVAADVGPIINLSGAEAQAQGAVVDGLSMMAAQQITMQDGRVQQQNFDHYTLLRMPQAPAVDVHFIQSEFSPTGLGEPALPPLIPAVCNAIFAANGERVRTLPLSKSGYTVV
ncbi:MAG TPA: molybdopterin cofactor-binding domain-containing protein [Steroidobacteraceae bacterium]|nr:molybdopterin cofactor-binding domain-containing protein [Steroidobacteraceae bacterium]